MLIVSHDPFSVSRCVRSYCIGSGSESFLVMLGESHLDVDGSEPRRTEVVLVRGVSDFFERCASRYSLAMRGDLRILRPVDDLREGEPHWGEVVADAVSVLRTSEVILMGWIVGRGGVHTTSEVREEVARGWVRFNMRGVYGTQEDSTWGLTRLGSKPEEGSLVTGDTGSEVHALEIGHDGSGVEVRGSLGTFKDVVKRDGSASARGIRREGDLQAGEVTIGVLMRGGVALPCNTSAQGDFSSQSLLWSYMSGDVADICSAEEGILAFRVPRSFVRLMDAGDSEVGMVRSVLLCQCCR